MKALLDAFIARLTYWLTPKPPTLPAPPAPIVVQAPPPPLRPGICECSHIRSIHVEGKGVCTRGYPKSKEWPDGARCACQIFIPKKNDPGDDAPAPPTPSAEELERMINL